MALSVLYVDNICPTETNNTMTETNCTSCHTKTNNTLSYKQHRLSLEQTAVIQTQLALSALRD